MLAGAQYTVLRDWPGNTRPGGETCLEFLRVAERSGSGLPKVATVQNAYSLVNRIYEHGQTEIAHYENIPLLAYSPLAFGQLTAKHRHGAFAPNSRLALFESSFGARYRRPALADAMQPYFDLAAQLGMTPATLALAWVNTRWFVGANIIGATTLAQLEENIKSDDVTLSPDVVAEIDRIHSVYLEPAQ